MSCLGAGSQWQTHCQPWGRKRRVFSSIIALRISTTSFKGIRIQQGSGFPGVLLSPCY